ncbi:MAG TPA: ABC transporter permease subunit [Roseiflexaceae bacterium]|nr:ABC transporter permease subunit [Roseiflexaceae bacterium]
MILERTTQRSAERESRLGTGATAALLASPLVLVLAALLIVPLLALVGRSLGAPGGAGWSLTSYAAAVGEPRYWRALATTTALAASSTLGALLLCTPAALYIEGRSGRAGRILAVLLTVPLSLPGIVIGFFVILFLGRTGVVTRAVEAAAGDITAPAYGFWGMLLGYIYFQIPRVVLVLRGAVAAIDPDLLDAARTLGAPPWRVYTAVILPMLRPALIGAASLSVATAFGAYGTAATLSRSERVLPLEIAAAFTERFTPELAAALSVLLALLTGALLAAMNSLLREQRRSAR